MIAALPMYDRAETRAATDRFWALIRDDLRSRGIDAPDTLTRDRDPWQVWTAPDLLLAQTCGLPYRAKLHDRVQLVATPSFDLPDCPPGQYCSVILGRSTDIPARPRLGVNDRLSQSGWAALQDWLETADVTAGPVIWTGGHAASARAVRDGAVDLAAVDAQTWALMQRHDGWTADLTVIARTAPTPGLPYITAPGMDAGAIRAALHAAFAALTPVDTRALNLRGIVDIPAEAYLSLPLPPAP